MMHSKRNRIAPTEGNNLRPRLHARTLLRQHEVTARKIPSRFGQQNRYLKRKYVLAV
jgi:hypothetical protein